jgi:hypothetical protein
MLGAAFGQIGQFPDLTANPGREQEERRLPNGKLQSEAILKANYEENLKDLEKLRKTAEGVEEEMRKTKGQVLSMKVMKELEEVEKLARRIRGRMARF